MRALAGISCAIALVFASCGGSSGSFPEEAECAAPAPIATSRALPGTISPQAYTQRMRSSSDALAKLRADLRAKYADDTFYRRDDFRPDFATYADQTVCTAQAMLDVTAPDTRFREYESTLDAALTDLVEHTRAGREAVRARNVSDYRKWFKDADAKIAAVHDAAFAQR